VTNFRDPKVLLAVSRDLGEAMVGLNEDQVKVLMAERGK
jgi:pyridoxal 5'-phosphate synthase pdxS subunit